jgi:hypothetical protein
MLHPPRFPLLIALVALACSTRVISFHDESPPPVATTGMVSTSYSTTSGLGGGATSAAGGGMGGFMGSTFGIGGFGGGVVTTGGGNFGFGGDIAGNGGSGPIAGATGSAGSATGGGAGNAGATGGAATGGSGHIDAGPDIVTGPKSVTYCTTPYPEPIPVTSDLLSDFDGDAGLGIHTVAPEGAWSWETDGEGTTSVSIEPCGTTGKGLHFKGAGHTIWGALLAATLVSPSRPVDVTSYHGVGFVMRSTVMITALVRVLAPYSQPSCGQCDDTMFGSECQSGYLVTMQPTVDDRMQVVPWPAFSQQSWGYRPPGVATFDPANLVILQFAFDKGVDFDVCIDDVKLVH